VDALGHGGNMGQEDHWVEQRLWPRKVVVDPKVSETELVGEFCEAYDFPR
jgi:hypothetical protein